MGSGEERQFLSAAYEDWNSEHVFHWGVPGERIRKKISTAVSQLKAVSNGLPTLLVLYDTVKFWPELLDRVLGGVCSDVELHRRTT